MARKRKLRDNVFLREEDPFEDPAPKPEFPFPKVAVLEEIEEPMLIHGRLVSNKYEYWVSLALDRLGIDYYYQFEINYGRRRRGGQVLDFLAFTPVRWTILDPRGRYWHTGVREDLLELQNVARQRHWRLLAWIEEDLTPTREATYQYLKAHL